MDTLATKRLSIWLLLIIWGFSASMQHPGFAMMVTSAMILVLLLVMRAVCHFEGEYMARAHLQPTGRIIGEFLIAAGIGAAFTFLLVMVVRHVPWLWFPAAGS
jgi:hypothetical protein